MESKPACTPAFVAVALPEAPEPFAVPPDFFYS